VIGPGRHGRPAALVLAALLFVTLALPVEAAGTTFGRPSVTARWAEGVTFEQPVVLGGAAKRVEIVISSAPDAGLFVSEIPVPAPGPATLRYLLDAGSSGLLPNTPFTARWRITWPDGTVDLGPPASTVYADTRFSWRTTSGPIVRVHWYTGDDAFGRRALAIGQTAIDKAAGLFGVRETRPIDFFVYADQAAFYDALGPGTRENVGGQANAEIRTLFALITPAEIGDRWVSIVIPHELTHLVFDTAVHNPYHDPPRWLNEGLAVYLAQGYEPGDRGQVAGAVAAANLMPLEALTGQFPTSAARFSLAYAESVSAVDFLVRRFGRDALVRLVRTYAGGVTDDEAFTAALGLDTAAFGAAWLADLGAARPERYGPRPAPAGPLPAAWTSGAGTSAAPSTSPMPDCVFWSGPGAYYTAPCSDGHGGVRIEPGSAAGEAANSSDLLPALAVALVVGLVALGLLAIRRRGRPAAGRDGEAGSNGPPPADDPR